MKNVTIHTALIMLLIVCCALGVSQSALSGAAVGAVAETQYAEAPTSEELFRGILSGRMPDGYTATPAMLLSIFDFGIRVILADPAFDMSGFEAGFAYPALRGNSGTSQRYACRYFVRKALILGDIDALPREVDTLMNSYSCSTPEACARYLGGWRAILMAEMALSFAREDRLLAMVSALCSAVAPGGQLGYSAERQIAAALVVAATWAMLGNDAEMLFANYKIPAISLPDITEVTPWYTRYRLGDIYDALNASAGCFFDYSSNTWVPSSTASALDRWRAVIGYLWPYVEELWPDYVDMDLGSL